MNISHKSLQQGIAPLIIAIVIGVIAIAAAGGVYLMRRSAPAPTTANTALSGDPVSTNPGTGGTVMPSDIPSNLETTMQSVLGRGQNLECDWTLPKVSTTPSPINNGKLYTSGTKGRSHITADIAPGISMEANAIYRDGSVYTWLNTNGTKMGFKMDQQEIQAANTELTAEQRQQAEQYRRDMIFNCRSWTPDESMFTVPTDITFKSSAEMMPSGAVTPAGAR